MPRRVGLPGASELFRSTADAQTDAHGEAAASGRPAGAAHGKGKRRASEHAGAHDALQRDRPSAASEPASASPAGKPPRRTSPVRVAADGEAVAHTGRVRHDEKITVYVSSEELLALEHLRLRLRGEHGIAVDRGRIVRAAIASALEEINVHGEDADVVKRLLEP